LSPFPRRLASFIAAHLLTITGGQAPSTLSYLIAAIRLSANHYVEVFLRKS
jgi:hypothetical protein